MQIHVSFLSSSDECDDVQSPAKTIDRTEDYMNNMNSKLTSLNKQLAIEMKVKQGAENMLQMLLKANQNKKLITETEQMCEDSKIKIDAIKMSILREEQTCENRNNTGAGGDVQSLEKSLEQRVDDIRHHIDIETRVAEGSRNMFRHFSADNDKKGQLEV